MDLSFSSLKKNYAKSKRGYTEVKRQGAEHLVNRYYASKVALYGSALSSLLFLAGIPRLGGFVLSLSVFMIVLTIHSAGKKTMKTLYKLSKGK